MIALKYHYIGYLLNVLDERLKVNSEKKSATDAAEGSVSNVLKLTADSLCRSWLKPDSSGFPTNLENFLRSAIKAFPYRDCMTFIQMVKTLSTVKVGDDPSAIGLFLHNISGLRPINEDSSTCVTCDEPSPSKRCARCKETQYCDRECQRLHWPFHKLVCKQKIDSLA